MARAQNRRVVTKVLAAGGGRAACAAREAFALSPEAETFDTKSQPPSVSSEPDLLPQWNKQWEHPTEFSNDTRMDEGQPR